MSKTKFGKKIVSLVLALTMLFAVSVSAISASAKISPRGIYTDGLVGKAAESVAGPVVLGLKLANPVRSVTDKAALVAWDIADKAIDTGKTTATLVAFNPITVGGKFLEDKAVLDIKDGADLLVDNAIIGGDALLLANSEFNRWVVEEPAVWFNRLAVRNPAALLALDIKAHALLGGPLGFNVLPGFPFPIFLPRVGVLRDGIIADTKDILVEDLPAIGLGEAGVIYSLVAPLSHPLTLAASLIVRDFGLIALPIDTIGLIHSALKFNTPILDTIALTGETLSLLDRGQQLLDIAGVATGATSIALGSALAAHNVFELLTNIVPATAITAARVGIDHINDNIFWNTVSLGTAALAATPVAVGATALGVGALGATALGATALGATALGAGALGLAGLTAANVAGAAALAAPVVATTVAAPVAGALALGTAAVGATALGAGALGAAALATNVLSNKDSSNTTTNPVDTVKTAVESVVPSQTSTEDTQSNNTQAQDTTASSSNNSVASTDGPIE